MDDAMQEDLNLVGRLTRLDAFTAILVSNEPSSFQASPERLDKPVPFGAI